MSQTMPCLFVDLPVVRANTRAMVELCHASGIRPVGITKLACGAHPVAEALIDGGIDIIGDSRIGNLEKLQDLPARKLLLRIPSVSRAVDVVRYADLSLNSEPHTVRALSAAAVALGRTHGVIVMHDLGDLREGCFSADDTVALARLVTELPGLELEGLGTNLACYGGVEPTTENQQQLVDLARRIERELGVQLRTVSGASSAALPLLLRGGGIKQDHPGRDRPRRLRPGQLPGPSGRQGHPRPVPHRRRMAAGRPPAARRRGHRQFRVGGR